MRPGRSHLDRLLDPNNDKVKLDTLHDAAAAVGKPIKLQLA